MHSKSFLMNYGYNVNDSVNIPLKKRHEILSGIIDLELHSKSDIITHLKWFIGSHTSPKDYKARERWNDDIDYVKNYKPNLSRFLKEYQRVKIF